ncbi:hypothetical protein BH10PAT1_BH10PAT1_4100 [soil metagenome]
MTELYSNEWYVDLYFKYGSVDEAEKHCDTYLSTPSYHRLLNRLGIIKTIGRREVSLTEIFYFFAYKALEPSIGIETLYKQMPMSFKTSLGTLHRIYERIVGNDQCRTATAVVFYDQNNNILLGKETQNKPMYGKFEGNYSLPMTFCVANEDPKISVLRVIQQEVLSKNAGEGKLKVNSSLTNDLIPENLESSLSLKILDIDLKVYYLPMNFDLKKAESAKLNDFILVSKDNIPALLRIGINDILDIYWGKSDEVLQPIQSKLNLALLKL